MGHLNKSCPVRFKKQFEVVSPSTEEWVVNQYALRKYFEKLVTFQDRDSQSLTLDSDLVLGKLKILSPTLFSSLNLKELKMIQDACLDISCNVSSMHVLMFSFETNLSEIF